jgi:predicted ATPase
LADCYTDGIAFVDLGPVRSSDQVLATLAQSLGVKELIGTALITRVCEHLQPRRMLIVLDNFEHLLPAAPLVAELLTAAPDLACLVTSRTVLRISGEHEYPLAPLDEAAAVALFVERARAARPTFLPAAADTPTLAELCRRLDCLPLALELAAARMQIFTPADLLTQLERSGPLALLTIGTRDQAPRQQSIRATIAWSYHLLASADQALFRRLAIFVGGWTFAAANAICNLEDDQGCSVTDSLQALVDHSLIQFEVAPDGRSRFRQLETIRTYAAELLAASGEADALRCRHARFFCDLAEAAAAHYGQPDETRWQRQVAGDYNNIQAALSWGTAPGGNPMLALRLAVALTPFWFSQNRPLSEGVSWIETALKAVRLPPHDPLRAHALLAAGHIVLFKGEVRRAEPLLTEARAIYEAMDDDRGSADALYLLGIQRHLIGQLAEACALQEASIQWAEQAQSKRRVARALSALGRTHVFQGAYHRAERVFASCLATEVLQSDANRAHIHALLADALCQQGDDARARALLEESIPVLRRDSGAFVTCTALFARARIAREQGDDEYAEVLLQDSLTLAHEQGLAYSLANTHYERGLLALARDELVQASWEMQQSLTFFRVLENPWLVGVALLGTGNTALCLDNPMAAARDYTESITLLGNWRENVLASEAALLVGLAGLLCSREHDSLAAAVQAVKLWALIMAHEPRTLGKRVAPPFLRLPRLDTVWREMIIRQARTILGEAAFVAAWEAGQALTLDQAIVYALEPPVVVPLSMVDSTR